MKGGGGGGRGAGRRGGGRAPSRHVSFSRSSFSSADLHAFFALPIAVAKKRYETPDGSAA